jgi:hypothetical protein
MQDAVIGAITCFTGCLFILGAAADNELLFNMQKIRWLSKLVGRPATRVMLGLLGVGLIALGIAVMQGWRFQLL